MVTLLAPRPQHCAQFTGGRGSGTGAEVAQATCEKPHQVQLRIPSPQVIMQDPEIPTDGPQPPILSMLSRH